MYRAEENTHDSTCSPLASFYMAGKLLTSVASFDRSLAFLGAGKLRTWEQDEPIVGAYPTIVRCVAIEIWQLDMLVTLHFLQ